jgi:hypothetical protein
MQQIAARPNAAMRMIARSRSTPDRQIFDGDRRVRRAFARTGPRAAASTDREPVAFLNAGEIGGAPCMCAAASNS